ncbi:hypothetical protein KGG93_gp23 [Streptomyces phage Endor2]|uniref:DUF7298 domain-containing protein n=1 Tax=Streptomyces phage Endor2 TaxID=2740182 RepID=A0A7G4AX28_9CAUD|nr:hypothetical protein KGG93_gp23 [Streptomyces phage Endor2]QMP84568.1 hypothetical protein HUN44_00023 [Streptomyces phage Endor2]
MGAGLYPPPNDPRKPLGMKSFQFVGTTSYVYDTETRAYLATWTGEANRLYRITANIGCVDSDTAGDQATTDHGSKNSAIIRGRWAVGTDATITSTDAGYMLASVFDDDSQFSSGTTVTWHLGGAPAGPLAFAVTLKPYKPAATYGAIRLLATSAAMSLTVEDVGPWPVV